MIFKTLQPSYKTFATILAIVLSIPFSVAAQTINSAYAKALHQKYPSVKTDFCEPCKLWVNPYYKSIADTVRHMPILTFFSYTKQMRLAQESLDLKRNGTFAVWYPSVGQVNESSLYTETNKIIGLPRQNGEIQKGHCQPWILLAYSPDGAILSNTYTFNSAMEYKGQNIGTQLESEEMCRELTGWNGHPEVTNKIGIWCGTYGSQRTYTDGKLTATVPTHYYKVLQYDDLIQKKNVIRCFWMPNQPTESRNKLASREVSYFQLKQNLGFDPMAIFKNY
jgi:DNA/RNA endonuclease G (NUC1)